MSRGAFERLMGPVEQVLAHQIAQYAQSNQAVQEAALAAGSGTDAAEGAAAEEMAGAEEAVEEVAEQAAGEEKEHEAASAAASPAVVATAAPAGQCAAALLPGSPRPPLRLSDTPGAASSSSFSYRRSTRGTRSSASCEMESAGSGGSPTALLIHLHHLHQQGARRMAPVPLLLPRRVGRLWY